MSHPDKEITTLSYSQLLNDLQSVHRIVEPQI